MGSPDAGIVRVGARVPHAGSLGSSGNVAPGSAAVSAADVSLGTGAAVGQGPGGDCLIPLESPAKNC